MDEAGVEPVPIASRLSTRPSAFGLQNRGVPREEGPAATQQPLVPGSGCSRCRRLPFAAPQEPRRPGTKSQLRRCGCCRSRRRCTPHTLRKMREEPAGGSVLREIRCVAFTDWVLYGCHPCPRAGLSRAIETATAVEVSLPPQSISNGTSKEPENLKYEAYHDQEPPQRAES